MLATRPGSDSADTQNDLGLCQPCMRKGRFLFEFLGSLQVLCVHMVLDYGAEIKVLCHKVNSFGFDNYDIQTGQDVLKTSCYYFIIT